MDIQQLKDFDISVADFEMIIKGLDALPNEDRGAEIMFTMLTGIVTRDMSPEEKSKIKREEIRERARREQERMIMKENIQMLTGKLIRLKRFMIENGLMEQIKDKIYPPPQVYK